MDLARALVPERARGQCLWATLGVVPRALAMHLRFRAPLGSRGEDRFRAPPGGDGEEGGGKQGRGDEDRDHLVRVCKLLMPGGAEGKPLWEDVSAPTLTLTLALTLTITIAITLTLSLSLTLTLCKLLMRGGAEGKHPWEDVSAPTLTLALSNSITITARVCKLLMPGGAARGNVSASTLILNPTLTLILT